MPLHLPSVTALKRASVSGPASSHINQQRCKGEREGRRDGWGSRGGGRQRGVRGDRGGMKVLPPQKPATSRAVLRSNTFSCLDTFLFLPLSDSFIFYLFFLNKPTDFFSSLTPPRNPPLHLVLIVSTELTPSYTHACKQREKKTKNTRQTPWQPWHCTLPQHLAAPNSLLLFIPPLSLSPLPPALIPPSPHRSHHSAIFPLCCFLPLSLPRCVVIINTPSSWADI